MLTPPGARTYNRSSQGDARAHVYRSGETDTDRRSGSDLHPQTGSQGSQEDLSTDQVAETNQRISTDLSRTADDLPRL